MWQFAALAVIGYFLGAIPNGVIVGRLVLGEDIREYGSGKMGATNVIRTAGAKWGLLVMALDAIKGGVPVLIARALTDDPWGMAIGGGAALVGHVWPVYVGFRGGRGVASYAGAVLAMHPAAAAPLIPVGAAILGATRIMSVMSISVAALAGALFIALAAAGLADWAHAALAAGGGAAIIALHKDNIARLLAGTEPKLGQGGQRRVGAEPAKTLPETR